MWFNPIMASLLRSPLHRWLSRNTMLISVRGRKTGRMLTTPVNYVRVGDELLVVSRGVRALIQTGSRAEQIQARAIAEGMRTLRQDGIEKVLMGLTSIEEVRATSNA